jgi:uncharacterized RDD family membrane protein YckC
MELNYKIIGGDGREYGPAGLEELKSWVVDGRVGAMTQVWRSDTERWAPGLHYLELQPHIASAFPVPRAASAGFWPRFAAYFLDLALVFSLFSLLWVPLAAHYGWKVDLTVDDLLPKLKVSREEAAAFFLLNNFLRALYEILSNGRFGATAGKMALGLRIVRLDGSRIGYTVALARWFACRLSDLTLGIGYLLVLIRPDKRALHDLLVGTKVVFQR